MLPSAPCSQAPRLPACMLCLDVAHPMPHVLHTCCTAALLLQSPVRLPLPQFRFAGMMQYDGELHLPKHFLVGGAGLFSARGACGHCSG